MSADTRKEQLRFYAAANHFAWGARCLQRRPGQDMGATQPDACLPPGHGPRGEERLARSSRAREPARVVFAGTEPAGLFRSEDWGETWTPVESLNRHEYRQFWGPTGGGDSTICSIELDPRDASHFYVGIASGGSYVTKDGGETWTFCSHHAVATNPGAKKFFAEMAEMFPNEPPNLPPNVDLAAADEFHKLRIDRKNPDRLWGRPTSAYSAPRTGRRPGRT